MAKLPTRQEETLGGFIVHGIPFPVETDPEALEFLKKMRPIQIEQEKFIEELQELIEMYEEMERQAGGPPSGNGPSSNPATAEVLLREMFVQILP